jgi:hypothetical protein
MIDPDAGACGHQTVPAKYNNSPPLDGSTLATRSSSSSLGELESMTAGIAGGNTSDECAHEYELDSPEMKNNNCKAADEVAGESWVAQVVGVYRDAKIERSTDNESKERPREDDLERTRFKDPFSSPSQSEASTLQQPSALLTTPIKSTPIENLTSWRDPFPTPEISVDSRCGTPLSSRMVLEEHILNADSAPSFRGIPKNPLVEECAIGSVDDDHLRQNETMNTWRDPFSTPDISVDSRCGTPLSLQVALEDHILNADLTSSFRDIPQIPLIEECAIGTVDDDHLRKNNYKMNTWRDPFPTPDASVDSRCGTPLSSVLADHDVLDGDGRDNNILNADLTYSFRDIPQIPLIEKCTIGSVDDDHCRQNDTMNTSCSRLESVKHPEFPDMKVSSESYFPLISILMPFLDYIWGALNVGPDGHELHSESIDEKIIDQKRDIQRRTSGKQDKQIHRRLDKEFAAPADASCERTRRRSCDASGFTKRNTIANATEPGFTKEVEVKVDRHRGGAPKSAMTPKRRAFQALKKKSSRAVATAAGELIFSPVRSVVHSSSLSAVKLVRNTRQKLRERRERRRLRRLARMNDPPRSWFICIPADHPCKVAWDVLTMIWAALGAYRTHVRIRDRVFDQSPLILLTEIWFTVDILLNFITEHKTRKGEVIRDGKAIWARYLTTWFIIDILSLIPWESIYVRPIVEKIKRRNIFQKTFFRSKATIRVSRVLRGRHIKLFGRVSKKSGISLHRLVTLVIKYLPKYLLFLRNMKGALVLRALRLVHWLHNLYKKIWVKARNTRQLMLARSPSGEADDDDDDDDDDDVEDEESEEDSDRDDEGKNESSTSLMDRRLIFHRANSEVSPLLPRRRSFSDGINFN